MSRPSWISRRSWYSPRFQWHYWRAKRHEARLIQQPCREDNCVELIDPKTGENTGGWGPVDCACQNADTNDLPPAESITLSSYEPGVTCDLPPADGGGE